MKNIFGAIAAIVALVVGVGFFLQESAAKEAFEKRNKLIAETNECLEMGEWNCAEKNVRYLLKENPDDQNLQLHLAGILFEQERYEECIEFSKSRKFYHKDLDFLIQKAQSLLQEMQTLQLARSDHFRVEFEGRPSRSDVLEALSVLEVAYDSLCNLFDFRPENKMSLVLYESSRYQGIGPRPEWVGAVFDGKLRIPVGMMQAREIYRPMFFHELTHAFVQAMTRSKIPLWINEGIAQVIDGSRRGMPRLDGAAPGLESLSMPFVNESSVFNATRLYWYSEQMVSRLLNRNPNMVHFKKFIQDIRHLGEGDALQKYYGVSAEQLLEEVKK